MDFFELIARRRSVRVYKDTSVEDEKIERIVQAANRAPSAGNVQAYRITVVKNPSVIEQLRATFYGSQKREAPVLLIFWADRNASAERYGERGAELYAIQDATIAAAYAQLAITELGLATVWVGAFEPLEIQRIFNKPDLLPVVIFPIGYADEEPVEKERKGVDELVENV